MPQAHIKIDKDLAVKGWRRAMRYKALNQLAYFYAIRLTIVWLVITTADALYFEEDMATYHLGILAILWLAATLVGYIKWYSEVEKQTVGWEFNATLDDTGVTTLTEIENEARHEWSFYKSYKEFDDYLQIDDEGGDITFLPKTDSLADIISFTKSKITKGN